ncbi:hypothetical protein, partial [Streptomyces sp. NPDC005989]|uniref:hypothetical protein n=1 Tax=Streptomyces sp. NPDC005989 TaxID=3156727 RepID=UPI0033ED17A5
LGQDFFVYYPYHLQSEPGLADLARARIRPADRFERSGPWCCGPSGVGLDSQCEGVLSDEAGCDAGDAS